LLVDRASIEVFANDGLASLSRSIPSSAENQMLKVQAISGSVQLRPLVIHKMGSVWQAGGEDLSASR